MDREKNKVLRTGKDNDPLQEDSSSSNADPIDQSAFNEVPQQFTGGDPYNLEKAVSNPGDLHRVISQPDNIRRLESLTRVLSARRLSVRGQSTGPLEVDPNDFDLNVLLKSISQRLDEQGIAKKYTGVTLDNVTVWGVDAATAYGPSVSELLRSIVTLPKMLYKMVRKSTRPIIRDVSGLVREGELLLVLGRPGSGCTTFLRAATGEISEFTKIDGEITYSGASQQDMLKHFKSEVIYNGELDTHFAHLTVEQTLRFAIACRTPSQRFDGLSRKDYQDFLLESLSTVFGLRHVLQTKVGNDYVRGVSGGERKRVSIAEALAARAAIYGWDNATRGLDASTALEYTHAIRAATNFLHNVGLVAIYQAGQNIYDLFDKVTVFYNGRQVYFGLAEDAKAYFENMGYDCPARQTTAEFLTSVTDPNDRTAKPGWEDRVPKTADEFVAYWKASPDFAAVRAEIDQYNANSLRDETVQRFADVAKSEKMKRKSKHSRYLTTFPVQLKLVMIRGFQRVAGDKAYTLISVLGTLIQGFIIGSLFYKIPNSTRGAFSRGGVMFFALLQMALTSLAEINSAFVNRPILMKQKTYSFYHPSAEAIQSIFSGLPSRLLTIICFGIVMYFLPYLRQTAGQFFIFLLGLTIATLALGGFFQMVASLTQDAQSANSIAGIFVLILVVYTGYMIPLTQMHAWFKWLSYLNPLRYGFETLMANEFHHAEMECADIVPRGPTYQNLTPSNFICGFTSAEVGRLTVNGDRFLRIAFGYSWGKAWRNIGLVIVFYIGFYVINCVATEFINPMAGGGDVLLFRRGHMPHNLDDEAPIDKEAQQKELEGIGSGEEEPDIFSWQHVDYTVPVKGGTRQLLCDVQGYVKPGTMTALMGESGAGKTTLLNVLSQRVDVGVITGDMFVNGKPLDDTFSRRTGYVQQQDLHLAESTVREALQFAARLRQPSNIPDTDKLAYVEKIINLLGMSAYSEALVGKVGRGLNVEQRKKLSIGVELVARPSLLLFLDEPTSGLDSQSARAIVSFMKELARAGQSILCTIHQPSATLFEEFDRLLMLKKGGRTVYFGDIGKNSSKLTSYFERNGARPCDQAENPAEYILECIGAGATASSNQDWGDTWQNSPECRDLTQEINQLHESLRARPEKVVDPVLKTKFAVGYFAQLRIVCGRTYKQFWRSPQYIVAKLMLMSVGGVFIGFTFFNIDDSISGMQNGMFAIFLILIISAPLSNQIEEFAEQSRDLYEVRESKSNTFHWSTLLIAQYFAEIPYHCFFSVFLFIGFYFPVGYRRTAGVAGYFYMVYCLFFQFYYTSFALMVFYFSPDSSSSAVITSILLSMMISFCGVMQPKVLMPGFWTFMWKVSPYTYFVQSFLACTLHNRPVRCAAFEYNIMEPRSGETCGEFLADFLSNNQGYVNNPDSTTGCEYCQYSVGDDFLKTVSASYAYKWRNIGFIWAFIIFNFFAMLGMYYLIRVKVWNLPDIKSILTFSWLRDGFRKHCDHDKSIFEPVEAPDFYKERPEDVEMAREVDNQLRVRRESLHPSASAGPPADLAYNSNKLV